MTAPNREQDARDAAEAWWAAHMHSFSGFMQTAAPAQTPRYVYEIFTGGAAWGRGHGMEESAEIAEDLNASLAGGQVIAQAIRAAITEGK